MSAIANSVAEELSNPFASLGQYFDDMTGFGGGAKTYPCIEPAIDGGYGGGGGAKTYPCTEPSDYGVNIDDLLYEAGGALGPSPYGNMYGDDAAAHPGKVLSSNVAGQPIWVNPEDQMDMS